MDDAQSDPDPGQGAEPIRFPPGRYVQLLHHIPAKFGGLTASSLQRSRAFLRHAGIDAPVLTVSFDPEFDAVRAALQERGDLPAGMTLLNMHEYYRDTPRRPGPQVSPLAVPRWLRGAPPRRGTAQEFDSAGRLVRTRHVRSRPWGYRQRVDYYRRDGSIYLSSTLAQTRVVRRRRRWILLRDDRSVAVERLYSWAALHRRFLVDVAQGDPLFVVVDGKPMVRFVAELREERIYLLPVVHNIHVRGKRRYYSPYRESRRQFFEDVQRFDGLVLLTARQGRDVAARLGARTNLFVVPHAVRELPSLSPLTERDPVCVMLVRLVKAKRVDHAIAAFRQVVDKVPHARLEIYGRGREAPALQAQIEAWGLQESVRLMGYSPDARLRLTTAAASIVTSRQEGQPLAVLESLAAGCPVVSYDIQYGPSDMIVDGEQGYLVPDGDVDALADRLARIFIDASLAHRLNCGARGRAQNEFGEVEFVRRWGAVFDKVVGQRARMTDLRSMSVNIDAHSVENGVERISGHLTVAGNVPAPAAGDVRVCARVSAMDSTAREFVEIPATCDHRGGGEVDFELAIEFARVRAQLPDGALAGSIELTWNNCGFRESIPLLDRPAPTIPETRG